MIYEQIKSDIKTAMKAYDAETVQTLRTLDAEIQNKVIAVKAKDPTDEIVIGVLQKGIKQRQESAEAFDKGGRTDLSTSEKLQIDIWKRYLPVMMGKDEIKVIVKSIIENMKESVNMGSVMKLVSPALKGKADGKLISEVVKEFLSGPVV